jgi:hypothetical protein
MRSKPAYSIAAGQVWATMARAGGTHGLGERVDVVGAVVATAVDEEGRRSVDATEIGAVDVVGHARHADPFAQVVREALDIEPELHGVAVWVVYVERVMRSMSIETQPGASLCSRAARSSTTSGLRAVPGGGGSMKSTSSLASTTSRRSRQRTIGSNPRVAIYGSTESTKTTGTTTGCSPIRGSNSRAVLTR